MTHTEPKEPPVLAIVAPCFNEEAVLLSSIDKLRSKIEQLSSDGIIHKNSFCLLVDDGSTDQTWPMILAFSQQHLNVEGLKLSANVGHQAALFAGLQEVADKCDCCVSIDIDLQDDIDVIGDMLFGLEDGYSIVLGVRNNRESDTFFKRQSANLYYRTARALGVDLIPHHADFRLLSQKALQDLLAFQEQNLFLRATPALLSQSIKTVEYTRLERSAGESKYPVLKMLALAWSGISSFSVWPLRLITVIGTITAFSSLMLGVVTMLLWLMGSTVQGWTSLMLVMAFFFSLILLSLAIIGEYLAKIYLESTNRPRFFVDKSTIE